jgi:hypothetical protein
MDERALHIQHCMYQYSRAIYRSIKDLVDPYVTTKEQGEYRKAVLEACEHTMERLARDPQYFAKPERSLPGTSGATSITAQAGWPGR